MSNIRNKQDIIALLQANAVKIKGYGVERLRLFGSFSRDTANDQSDIDLLIDFNPAKKNFDHFMDLSFFLEDLFKRKVEIVTPQSLNKFIGPHILESATSIDF